MTKFDNMLIKYIWPRELHQLVEQYRAEGCLNEEAVRNVNKTIKGIIVQVILLVLVTFGSLLFIMSGVSGVMFSLFGSILLYSFFGYRTFKHFTMNYLFPINLGQKVRGGLLEVHKHTVKHAQLGWILKFSYSSDGKTTQTNYVKLTNKQYFDHSVGEGDEMDVFIYSTNPQYALPALKTLTNKYSLKQEKTS